MRVHDLAVAHDHRALDRVLQLAHVARPVIRHQHVDRGRRDALDVLAVRERRLFEKVIGEQQQVGLPLAQRRNEDREHVRAGSTDPRGSCPSAIAFSMSLFVAAISRTFARIVFVPPEPLEFARLQHAQQLDLRREVELADFVEKQRAPLRQLETSLFRARARR